MEEITFSVFGHGVGSVENLPTLLREFERQSGIRVHLDAIPAWVSGWSRLVETALYHDGPEVSEVGDTWVGDLVRMEALRPFTREEVDEITQGAHFFKAVWRSSTRDEDDIPMIYSIPLTSDPRVIFYRRDLLEKAGIDEKTAFEDFAHFEKTLSVLKEQGHPLPLALPTKRSYLTIHYLASWIWGAGGDFLSQDGTSLAFNRPEALEACKAYFRLVRFLTPSGRNLEEAEADSLFGSGKAVVLPSGFWILSNELAAEVRENLATAPMPGVPFVGGHHVVIWHHSRHDSSAIKLIRFLHTREVAQELYPLSGLPISEEGWDTPPFNSEIYQAFKAAIQKGRGFPAARLWGLVEKRLTDVLSDIWVEVQKEPEARLDMIVETRLVDLAHRLQLSLGS